MFIIFRAIAGRQKLADRILVVLHDRVEQERGDSQVRQVIELGNHSSQVATPKATLIALAILEKTVAHDVIRGVTIEEFLDDHGIDDLILPARASAPTSGRARAANSGTDIANPPVPILAGISQMRRSDSLDGLTLSSPLLSQAVEEGIPGRNIQLMDNVHVDIVYRPDTGRRRQSHCPGRLRSGPGPLTDCKRHRGRGDP